MTATTEARRATRARATALGWPQEPGGPRRRNRARVVGAVVLMVVSGWLGAVRAVPALKVAAGGVGTGVGGADPLRHAVPLGAGMRGLVAPTTGLAAEAALLALGGRLPVVTAGRSAAAVVVVVDTGRWVPSQPIADRLAGADLVLVVCRPTLDGVEHTRGLLSSLRATLDVAVGVVVVGDAPYAPGDIERALAVPVVGALPWEPRAVLGLVDGGAEARAWRRSRLAAVAGELADRLSRPAAEAAVDG